MIVEVVAVGTELLLGQIVNGNGAAIGAALADAGLDAHYQQVVGDNLGRIESALRTAIERSDAVVITGGIGPTQDDLTREGISAATARRLLVNEEYAKALAERFTRLGRQFPASNLRQAEYPEGGEQLPNPKGTAPGIVVEHEGTTIFALPGVPEEMEYLLHQEVIPRLRRKAGVDEVLVSRMLRTWGRSESNVAELLDDLYTSSSNPSIAFLASGGEIKVRITAKAGDAGTAAEMIRPVEAMVRDRLGEGVFGVDDETIEPVVLRELDRRAWTVATAESATGGLVAARLTSIPGSSKTVLGAVVAYSTPLKADLLGVGPGTLQEGVVSEPTALEMADGVCKRTGADVGVGITGSAGPEPQEREVGTMVIAVVTPEGRGVRTLRFPGDRERVRTYASTAALHLLRLGVTGAWWSR